MGLSSFSQKPLKHSENKECLLLIKARPSISILNDSTSKNSKATQSQAFLMANSLKKALKVSASYDASVIDGNKRRRESEVLDGSNIVSEKIKAIEDLRDMGIRQLREQAILRGLSSTGSKKELLYRLCAESEKESKNFKPEGKELEDEEEETSNKDEKVTTSGNKGTAVLDQYLPDHIRTQYHVLEHGDSIYDATLNQTNVGDNHNKFYLIQALESNDSSKFMVYTRWGRVGIKGQDKLQGPYTSRGSAIQEFEAKFFSKTKNRWLNRKDFICHPKCYIWLETDYEMNKESPERAYSSLKEWNEIFA